MRGPDEFYIVLSLFAFRSLAAERVHTWRCGPGAAVKPQLAHSTQFSSCGVGKADIVSGLSGSYIHRVHWEYADWTESETAALFGIRREYLGCINVRHAI
jgi:hypothetical protein